MPYGECEGCTHVCRFRMHAVSATSRRGVQGNVAALFDERKADPPAPPPDAWWDKLDALLVPLRAREGHGLDPAALADLDACTYMHMLRWWYTDSRGPLIAQFRQRQHEAAK